MSEPMSDERLREIEPVARSEGWGNLIDEIRRLREELSDLKQLRMLDSARIEELEE